MVIIIIIIFSDVPCTSAFLSWVKKMCLDHPWLHCNEKAWERIAEAVKEREKIVTLPEEEEKQEEKPS